MAKPPIMPVIDGRKLYLRILKYTKAFWLPLAVGLLGNALYSGVDSAMIAFLKPIVNKGFVARNMHFIAWLPGIIMGFVLLRAIGNFLGTYFMSYVSRSIVMKFRQQIFDHFLKIPASYYDTHSAGQLLSLMLYNVEQIASVSATALTDAAQNGFLMIGLLIVMFHTSWKLTLVYFFTIPAIALVVKITSKLVRRVGYRTQTQMGEVTAIAEETVTGYKVVRAFGGQAYERNKFYKATRKNLRFELRNTILKIISVSSTQIIGAMALALVLYLATATKMGLTAGAFAALITAMLTILRPLKIITTVNNTIQRGLSGAQSVFEFIDAEEEKDQGQKILAVTQGAVEYREVCFTYPGTEKNILQKISFKVAPGQILALVGRSGAGKSTIVSLLPRFYDHQAGGIFIDGQEINEVSLESLRAQIALVSQQVTLFNDTVAKNVAYGQRREASEAEIIQALKAAHAWEFVEPLAKGIHTLVGEDGVLLSGGQRQRLAIARAILKNAPILILDEATSSLDTESERHIQEALDELVKNRTTIVIAHRLSTIENADRILVLEEGRVVEEGNHQELLARQGFYEKLYNMQFRD